MHAFDRAFRFVLPAGALAVLSVVLAVAWFTQPDRYARGYAPSQPIPFSHQLHAGQMKIDCLYCHGGATRARAAGIPSVETCMNCHRVTRTESPAIQRLAALHRDNAPLVWSRVHTLPDHVFFDHRPHVNVGVSCQTCHGEVQDMPVLTRQMSMRMANCLGCHRDPHAALPKGSLVRKASEDCNACHR